MNNSFKTNQISNPVDQFDEAQPGYQHVIDYFIAHSAFLQVITEQHREYFKCLKVGKPKKPVITFFLAKSLNFQEVMSRGANNTV